MGRSGQKLLDRLIGEVARGEHDLSSIRDARLREDVRVALRLHKDVPAPLDAYAKARMRARVLAGLRPRRLTLLDTFWAALELLARPAPYLVRLIGLASMLVCLGMGAIVASADTLPDDLLYPLKIVAEQVRLGLADAPGDRAAVELSIAQHRLSEAETLAGNGRTSDALVASAMYSQHIAWAAEALASQPEAELGAQLEFAFTAQRDRAQALAVTLASDVKSASGAKILAMIAAPALAPATTKIEQVAETAASVAGDLADAADQAASESASLRAPQPSEAVERSDTPLAVFAERTDVARATVSQPAGPTQRVTETVPVTDAPFATETGRTQIVTRATEPSRSPARTSAEGTAQSRVSPAQTQDPRASETAKIAHKAAADARAAAEKLKQALKERAETQQQKTVRG